MAANNAFRSLKTTVRGRKRFFSRGLKNDRNFAACSSTAGWLRRWLPCILLQNFIISSGVFLVLMLEPVSCFECPTRFGYYPHPRWCNRYFVCNFGFAFPETCALGLQFSLPIGTCDWPRNVNCSEETGFALRPGQPLPSVSSMDDFADEQMTTEDTKATPSSSSSADADQYTTPSDNSSSVRHSTIKFSFSKSDAGNSASVSSSSSQRPALRRGRHSRIPITVNLNMYPTAAASTTITATAADMPPTFTTTRAPPTTTTTTTTERPRPFPAPEVGSYADPCDEARCPLPWCRCASADIPGGLSANSTPQLVLISFDNSVNEVNFGLYQKLFNGKRKNPNGCPISATFFVSHQWTKYNLVQNLFAAGHEIASLGITGEYYEHMSERDWQVEIAGQRQLLSMYGNISRANIKGMRAPFLRPGGNKQLKMLYDNQFLYDSSYPIWENDPPYYPYTYDFLTNAYCMVDDCVEQSFPGIWEVPLVMWRDSAGSRCHTPDTCNSEQTVAGIYDLIKTNFDRHYKQNRAPFTVFLQSPWFAQEGREKAFTKFLDDVLALGDVYVVTITQAIEWIKNPMPLQTLKKKNKSHIAAAFHCDLMSDKNAVAERTCTRPKKCNPWFDNEKSVRFFETCMECPSDYPWTNNVVVEV